MSQIPDYTENVSLRLSQVLDEIGVNDKMVLKRRRLGLLSESLHTITSQLNDYDAFVYYLGSRTESTTTPGLQSDVDILYCIHEINVIQDWAEWKPGVINFLMIQDETVYPGYCLLQCLRADVPLPENNVSIKSHYRDRRGRVLMKNTLIHDTAADGTVRHGPANSSSISDFDFVRAFPCKSWPIQASPWLGRQGVGGWPSDEMRRYCSSTGCVVVAVGSKGSENEELEWRISTSLAERCCMFDLNITQIRCYILMKMILKTFISPHYPDNISSFMCKTVLLHCIANTQTNVWRENSLLTCLKFCLTTLNNCVLNEVCPHFIIPENNLMAGRFSPVTKPNILGILQYIVNSNGRALLQIDCDELGLRLHLKHCGMWLRDPQMYSTLISGHLVQQVVSCINASSRYLLSHLNKSYHTSVLPMLAKYMFKIINKYVSSHEQDKIAYRIIAHQLCTTLGAVLSSFNISLHGTLTLEALTWMSFGLNSDVSTSKLKLASIFYCIGDAERTEMILKYTEECYDLSVVEPACGCPPFDHSFPHQRQPMRSAFNRLSFQTSDVLALLKHISAPCVRFLPCEKNGCPYELQYEMFRSTQEDLAYTGKRDDWMDWAVVDSLPYLYFLQYKTYNSLRRQEDKQRALSNLAKTIGEEPNLGHRETALNLLGQCMEQEERHYDALRCYVRSLQVRRRNNAANIHICRLLSSLINH